MDNQTPVNAAYQDGARAHSYVTNPALLASNQITIPYNSELNILGQDLHNKCKERYNFADYKDTITEWTPVFYPSGRFSNGEPALENHIIVGTKTDGTCQSTSYVVLLDRSPEPKWAYTMSGSLYALQKKYPTEV